MRSGYYLEVWRRGWKRRFNCVSRPSICQTLRPLQPQEVTSSVSFLLLRKLGRASLTQWEPESKLTWLWNICSFHYVTQWEGARCYFSLKTVLICQEWWVHVYSACEISALGLYQRPFTRFFLFLSLSSRNVQVFKKPHSTLMMMIKGIFNSHCLLNPSGC